MDTYASIIMRVGTSIFSLGFKNRPISPGNSPNTTTPNSTANSATNSSINDSATTCSTNSSSSSSSRSSFSLRRSRSLTGKGRKNSDSKPNEQQDEKFKVVMTCGFEETEATNHDFFHHVRDLHYYRYESKLKIMGKLISKLKLRGSQDDPILQYHDVTVYENDLRNLQDNEWFNDNNISFLYEYLDCTVLNEFSSIALLRPSLSYLLLHTVDPKDLRTVLPSFKSTEFIFLPINDNPDVTAIEGGCHWSLLIVSLIDKKALHYDTLNGANNYAARKTSTNLEMLLDTKLDYYPVHTPQQSNMADCGILVCEITSILVKRLINASKDGRIELGLSNYNLVAPAGRTYMLLLILQLVSERKAVEINS